MFQTLARNLILAGGATDYTQEVGIGANNRVLLEVLYFSVESGQATSGLSLLPQYSNDLVHWKDDDVAALATASEDPPYRKRQVFTGPDIGVSGANPYQYMRVKIINGDASIRAMCSVFAELFTENT